MGTAKKLYGGSTAHGPDRATKIIRRGLDRETMKLVWNKHYAAPSSGDSGFYSSVLLNQGGMLSSNGKLARRPWQCFYRRPLSDLLYCLNRNLKRDSSSAPAV